MDGVLADTEPLHEKSRDVLLAKLGLDVAALSPRAYAKSKRLYWGEVAKECQLSLTAEELTQEEFVILMDIAEHSGLKANPGVEKAICSLRSEGFLTAVASSSDRVYVEKILNITGLADKFDKLSCGNEVAACARCLSSCVKTLRSFC